MLGTKIKRLDFELRYLVAHSTDRKWVATLVINRISGVSRLITGVN